MSIFGGAKMHSAVSIYKETGDFYETCKKTGLTALTCHIILAKAGVMKIRDKIEFGTRAQRLGGMAEAKFQEMVPDAIDANRMWKQNNPAFDFCVRGITVDVKYSSMRESRGKWCFDVSNRCPDLYCVFCEKKEGAGMDEFYLLLIPAGLVQATSNLTISRSGVWFEQFQVDEKQLNDVLDAYAEIARGEQK